MIRSIDALPGSAHTCRPTAAHTFESHGLVTRTAYAETPPRVVYELTPVGHELRSVLEAMYVWARLVPVAVFEP